MYGNESATATHFGGNITELHYYDLSANS